MANLQIIQFDRYNPTIENAIQQNHTA